MKLLASVVNVEEAKAAIIGGAHIIDVKNPDEGSLGANFPQVIREIFSLKTVFKNGFEVSAAVGDAPNLPGTISLDCVGAAAAGADYVKVGLFGVKNEKEAIYMMKQAKKSLNELGFSSKLVVAGYADAAHIGAVPPLSIPEVGRFSDCEVVMLDTIQKNKGGLFDFISLNELRFFVDRARSYGLKVALAGSLKAEDISKLYDLSVDIVGVRGALCEKGLRTAKLKPEKVQELASLINPKHPLPTIK
jgi:uncharacterized protein (UPF0264 family)